VVFVQNRILKAKFDTFSAFFPQKWAQTGCFYPKIQNPQKTIESIFYEKPLYIGD
jgi:hypothetical protein